LQPEARLRGGNQREAAVLRAVLELTGDESIPVRQAACVRRLDDPRDTRVLESEADLHAAQGIAASVDQLRAKSRDRSAIRGHRVRNGQAQTATAAILPLGRARLADELAESRGPGIRAAVGASAGRIQRD